MLCLLCSPVEAQKRKKQKAKAIKNQCEKVISQGIKGRILFLAGNQMPSPGKTPSPGTGVSREVVFFEVARMDQTVSGASSGFFKEIKTKLVKKVWSDRQGCIAVHLPKGNYSVLVKEKGEWYANQFNGEGEIFPVEVREGEVTPLEFRITYKAAF